MRDDNPMFKWLATLDIRARARTFNVCTSVPKFIDALVRHMDVETLQWANKNGWRITNRSRRGAAAVGHDAAKTQWLATAV